MRTLTLVVVAIFLVTLDWGMRLVHRVSGSSQQAAPLGLAGLGGRRGCEPKVGSNLLHVKSYSAPGGAKTK